MTIEIICHQCGKKITLGAEFAGAVVQCPFCQEKLRVENPATRPSSPPPLPKEPSVVIIEKSAPLPAGYTQRLSNGAVVAFGPRVLDTAAQLRAMEQFRDKLTVCSESATDLLLPETLMVWAVLFFDHPLRGAEGAAASMLELEAWKSELLDGVNFGSEPAPKISLQMNQENWMVLLSAEWIPPKTGHWPGVQSGEVKRAALAVEAAYNRALARKEASKPVISERAMTHGGGGRVSAVAVSPDGRFALSGGEDRNVRLWDLTSGTEVKTIGENWKPIGAVAFLGDGGRMASMNEGSFCARDCADGSLIFEEFGSMEQMSATSDGRFLITASTTGSGIYDLEKRFCVGRLGDPYEAHDGGEVRAVAYSPDGARVLTAGFSELKLWQIDTFKVSNCLKNMHWRYEIGKALHCFTSYHMLEVRRFAFLPGTQKALATGNGGRPCLIDLETFAVDGIFDFAVREWTDFAVSRDGRRIAVIPMRAERPAVTVLDASSGKAMRTFEGHGGPITAVGISADGSCVVSGDANGGVRCWGV